jgi:hypothetical protein
VQYGKAHLLIMGVWDMAEERNERDQVEVDVEKRETLRRMIASTAFIAPVVASFPISGLTIDKAMAQSHYGFVDPFFRLFS